MEKKGPNLCNNAKDCCGCTACSAICPVKAIYFEYNSEGFLYPVINRKRCIGCLKCEAVCAYKKDKKILIGEKKDIHIYAAKARDKEVVTNSSSGGIFTILSDLFLEKKDAVVSCIYAYDEKSVKFSWIDSKSKRNEARGSKYIQAEAGDTFSDIVKWLLDNPHKNMLVVGTGCQIAGLDLVLSEKKLRSRVVLVDLICHGAASSGLWKEFISNLEKKNGGKINNITFKDKRNGWENPSVFVKIENKEVSIKPYADWFYMGWSLRESCYECPYARIDRNSDITIGDFWGIQNVMPEFYDNMGVSLVITHNEKGEKIFDLAKKTIDFYESNRKDCLQPRLMTSQVRPKNRDSFWKDMNKKGIEFCEKKYFEYYKVPLKVKMKNSIKRILKNKHI